MGNFSRLTVRDFVNLCFVDDLESIAVYRSSCIFRGELSDPLSVCYFDPDVDYNILLDSFFDEPVSSFIVVLAHVYNNQMILYVNV